MIKKKRIFFWSANSQIQENTVSTSQCDTNVTPALFAEHFSKLYSSKHILRNVSGDVYDVRNDILDGQFSLYEVECTIKHLKSGKATGEAESETCLKRTV